MRYILITGIGRGLGMALAQRFLKEEDITVIGTSRQEVTTISHPRLKVIVDDISESGNDFEKIINALEGIKLQAIVHNAAVLQNKLFGQYNREDLEYQFNVNVFTPFLMTQALSDKLSSGSHVVNIGSMGGYQGSVKFPGLSAYSASKAAISVFTECLAEEWKSRNISVNCLSLGSVNTEMLAEAFPGYIAPLSPEQMAEYIAKFTLEGHQFFNGKIIPVSITVP